MTDLSNPAAIAALYAAVKAKRPLVQNITNYVAMTISANVLLALGASPAMVHAAEEVEDFGSFTDSLVVNIGTLSADWIRSMKLAAAAVTRAGRPFVLDPVACGATRLRTEAANDLLKLKPAVVRGNAGEIMALAGSSGAQSKGVDSLVGADAAIETAIGLAKASGAIVAITGEIDYVTDGIRVAAITGGHALMPLSTAIGCALTGVVGAFVTVAEPFEATVAALSVYAAAGSLAGERSPNGPGHLPAELCDALYFLDATTIARRSTVTLIR
ncbi:MAG: hydroxyethylthiazole kinase [Ancalomicrobiaceae bacterium]|nr:hydroxyethylthiazole kinase [Ancalomicrobiaceae bacterium]